MWGNTLLGFENAEKMQFEWYTPKTLFMQRVSKKHVNPESLTLSAFMELEKRMHIVAYRELQDMTYVLEEAVDYNKGGQFSNFASVVMSAFSATKKGPGPGDNIRPPHL